MNKKQLTLQNSSLFAELERKTKEIDILTIRLEEAEQKIQSLSFDNASLKESLENADAQSKILFEKNQELEKSLEEAKEKISQGVVVAVEDTKTEEISQEKSEITQMDLEIFEKIDQVTKMTEDSYIDPPKQEEQPKTVEKSTPNEEPEKFEPLFTPEEDNSSDKYTEYPTENEDTFKVFEPQKSNPSLPATDLLRDYGAKIIGKVTRVTAEVLSKVNALNNDASESLKTLALGKNESFKFQIMELAKRKTNPEQTMAEMDLLADEAVVYLRSI